MSKRAILAATAIVAASFNPVITTSAWAAVTFPGGIPAPTGPTQDTKDAMQDQCDAKALAHGANWTGTLDEGSIGPGVYVSGPTEVGTHSPDDAEPGTLEGAGDFTPASIEYSDPFRNGGSVNMWADGTALGGYYSASEYDFVGDFDTVYSYAFNCNMSETVATPAEGHHYWQGVPGSEEDQQNACDAITANGQHVGEDVGQCLWVETAPPGEDEVERPDEEGIPIEETQRDELLAHENDGPGFFDAEPAFIGKVLVCISPTTSTQTKKGAPGTWVAKHGYVGSSVEGEPGCNTTWYNTGATVGVSNLNDGSNNVVTIPVVLP